MYGVLEAFVRSLGFILSETERHRSVISRGKPLTDISLKRITACCAEKRL